MQPSMAHERSGPTRSVLVSRVGGRTVRAFGFRDPAAPGIELCYASTSAFHQVPSSRGMCIWQSPCIPVQLYR